jgi:cation diffusion facilitator family transporter
LAISSAQVSSEKSEKMQSAAAKVSLWGSLTLFFISAAAGLAVDSITLILDASASLVILAVACMMDSTIKKIHSPPDEIFNFGYEKYEPFTVVLQGCLIITTCAISIKFAVQDIIHAESMKNYWMPVLASSISVVAGFGIVLFLRMAAKRSGSSMLHAAGMHWFVDTMMSVGMLLGFYGGYLLEHYGYPETAPYVDPVMAIVLALVFMLPPLKTVKKNLMELLDAVPSKEIRAQVRKVAEQYRPKMFGIHRIRTRKAGNKIFVDICFVVKEEMTVREVEEISAAFEKDLKTHLPHLDIIVYFKPNKRP